MLQAQRAVPRIPPQALKQEATFPPPASDLAKASIRRTVAVPAPAAEETITNAVLAELDLLLKDAAGEQAITKILEGLGLDMQKAVQHFVGREENRGKTAADLIHNITGIDADKIRLPAFKLSMIELSARHSETDIHHMTAKLIRELVKDGAVSLRDLTIESVARVTLERNQGYKSRKEEVARIYEGLFENMCSPRASDVFLYAAGGIGRALKAAGLFLLQSAIIENLPTAIKEESKLSSLLPRSSAAWWTSVLMSGTAGGLIVIGLFPGPIARNWGEAAAAVGISAIVGSVVELVGRGLVGIPEGKTYPGATLLELLFLPYVLGKKAISSLSPLSEKIREDRKKRLKNKGL